jgi:Na+/proline symporter
LGTGSLKLFDMFSDATWDVYNNSICQDTVGDGKEGDLACGGARPVKWFYVMFGIFIFTVFAIAVYSYWQGANSSDEGEEYSSHYVGNKSFGWLIISMSQFATIFSGYTVIGVPREVAQLGFLGLRHLVGAPFIMLGALLLAPRVRRLSVARNYLCPLDITADRFNNCIWSFLALILTTIPLAIYVLVQMFAIKKFLEGMSHGEMDGETAIWCFCFFMLVCEMLGGIRAASYSDCFQAIVIIICLGIFLPAVCREDYGGFNDILPRNCKNGRIITTCTDNGSPLLPHSCTDTHVGCVYDDQPYFLLHPATGPSEFFASLWNKDHKDYYNATATGDQGAHQAPDADNLHLPTAIRRGFDNVQYMNRMPFEFLSYSLAGAAFILYPHLMQRLIAAKSDNAFKKSNFLLVFVPLFVTLPAIYFGFVYIAEIATTGAPTHANEPYVDLLDHIIQKGGGTEFMGLVSACAGIAAMMSTADSALLSISNQWSMEVYRYKPDANPSFVLNCGKVVSIATMILVTAIAQYDPWMNNGSATLYGDLFLIATTFLWQLMPATFYSLFWSKASAWPCIIATLISLPISLYLCVGVYMDDQNGYGTPFDKDNREMYLHPAVWGGGLNIIISVILTLVLPTSIADMGPSFSEEHSKRYGPNRLDGAGITKIMEGTTEPLKTPIGAACAVAVLALSLFCMPWWGDSYNGCSYVDFDASTANGLSAVATARGDCKPEELLHGMPRWAAISIGSSVACMFLLCICWTQYGTIDTDSWSEPISGTFNGVGADNGKADDATPKGDAVDPVAFATTEDALEAGGDESTI